MKLLRRSITFPEKEFREEIDAIAKRLEAYERFEDDVRDVMDFMEHDEHYVALNEALRRLLG